MKIRFLEIAQFKLDEAIDYYNSELPGLGGSFLTEILRALDKSGYVSKSLAVMFKAYKKVPNTPFSVWNYIPNIA